MAIMKYKLSELVAKFGGTLVGADISVTGIAPTDLADPDQITFLSDNKYKKNLYKCKAGAIIINETNAQDISLPKIVTSNPYYYFSLVSNLFNPRRKLPSGISGSANIDSSAVIGENPAISTNVVIGKNTKIGQNCQIFPNVVIGDDVIIGDNATIYPNVTIYDKVVIGNDCVFHGGCVIGSDGFGNAQDEKRRYHRIPQIGGVLIGNQVEIGANATIDCGTFTPTIIEDGVRIDNLVQIAHNVVIGAHTGIASMVGIAGNTKIGRHCMIAGGAGIADHVEICDFTVIGASSNVGKNVTKPGLYSSAMTILEYKTWARTYVHIRNIDKMHAKLHELEAKLELLEGKTV